MKKTVTKQFHFDSAHRLIDETLSKEENKNVFGKCYNFPGHGHRWLLYVTVSSDSENYGMIINFKDLKNIVNYYVIDKLDHQFINKLDDFKGVIPTCENMIEIIWKKLEQPLSQININLERLDLYETPTSYATLKKDIFEENREGVVIPNEQNSNKPTVDITKEEIRRMLYELGNYKLRQSARDFIDSLSEQLDNNEKPTRKQIELLMKIKKEYDKWHEENKLTVTTPE